MREIANFFWHGPISKLEIMCMKSFVNNGFYVKLWTYSDIKIDGIESCDYKDNNFERYYPVKDLDGNNRRLYQKYKDMTPDRVKFIGRCGQYVYIDMHQAIASALSIAKKFIKSTANK